VTTPISNIEEGEELFTGYTVGSGHMLWLLWYSLLFVTCLFIHEVLNQQFILIDPQRRILISVKSIMARNEWKELTPTISQKWDKMVYSIFGYWHDYM
jgi:hypothetical protein